MRSATNRRSTPTCAAPRSPPALSTTPIRIDLVTRGLAPLYRSHDFMIAEVWMSLAVREIVCVNPDQSRRAICPGPEGSAARSAYRSTLAVAFLACDIPAGRAAGRDPRVALREASRLQ